MEKNNRLSLLQAIGVSLSNPFFRGRSRRSEFWGYTLFFVCIESATTWLQYCLMDISTSFLKLALLGLLFLIQLLACYFQLAVTFRRLHDVGKNGWWAGTLAILKILISVLVFTGNNDIANFIRVLFVILFLIIILGFCTIDSQKEENKYGTSPKYDINYVNDTSDFLESPLGIIVVGCLSFLVVAVPYCVIGLYLSTLLCNIDPNTTYSWYSGIWHGLFFLPNLIKSWLYGTLYKAEHYTIAYNIFWWCTVIWNGLFFFIGGIRDN